MDGLREDLPASHNRRIAHSPEEMEKFINYFTFALKLRFINNIKTAATVTSQDIAMQQEKYQTFSPIFEILREHSVGVEKRVVTFDPSIKCYTCTIAPAFPLDLAYQDLQSVKTLAAALDPQKSPRQWIQGMPYDLVLTQEEARNEEVFRFLLNAAVVETLPELLGQYRLLKDTSNGYCTLL
jgi:hypothetical protein